MGQKYFREKLKAANREQEYEDVKRENIDNS